MSQQFDNFSIGCFTINGREIGESGFLSRDAADNELELIAVTGSFRGHRVVKAKLFAWKNSRPLQIGQWSK